jgi:hypothetical protein
MFTFMGCINELRTEIAKPRFNFEQIYLAVQCDS